MQGTYIKNLQKQRIWGLDYVAGMTGSLSSAKGLMHSYTNSHIVSSVRRDMYVANDLASERPLANKFEIASAVCDDSFVAYHSALEYHGLGHQVTYEVNVGSVVRFRNFTFDGLKYVCCPQRIMEGVLNPPFDSGVRVTDLERTIVDCTDRVDLADGWEELLNCLSSCSRGDPAKIFHYAGLYDKLVLYRKLGLICEIFADNWEVTPEQLEAFRQAGGSSVMSFTDRQDSNVFVNSWRMYVPEGLTAYLNKNTNDEII